MMATDMVSPDEIGIEAALRAELAGRSALLLEDEAAFYQPIIAGLESFGVRVDHFTRGEAARDAALARAYDVVLLDRINPGIDGIEVLRAIRAAPPGGANSSGSAVLMVTSLGDSRNLAHGLVVGADDYVPKPVTELELIARIAAQVRRRASPRPVSDRRANGPLVLSVGERSLTFRGAPLQVQAKPFAVLAELMANPGQPLTKLMLFERCWPEWTFVPDVWETNLYATIARVKAALEPAEAEVPPGFRPMLLSVRGQGYAIRDLSGL